MRITGYVYRADIYCPTCIIETMVAGGEASPAARDMSVEDALDQIADANAIDRYDEWSFDTDDFPKVIFSIDDDDCYCGRCGKRLGQ